MRFTVPGPPVPKKRPRVVKFGGKAHAYTPQETVSYERKVGWVARMEGVKPTPKAKEVVLSVYFYYKGRRPDIDNLVKAVMDGLNSIGYEDDNQVGELHIKRLPDPANPRAVVTVEEIVETAK